MLPSSEFAPFSTVLPAGDRFRRFAESLLRLLRPFGLIACASVHSRPMSRKMRKTATGIDGFSQQKHSIRRPAAARWRRVSRHNGSAEVLRRLWPWAQARPGPLLCRLWSLCRFHLADSARAPKAGGMNGISAGFVSGLRRSRLFWRKSPFASPGSAQIESGFCRFGLSCRPVFRGRLRGGIARNSPFGLIAAFCGKRLLTGKWRKAGLSTANEP